MNKIIGPLSQVYGVGVACCQPSLGGRTPAEYSLLSGSAPVESPVNTWTFSAASEVGFNVCCKLSFTVTASHPGGATVLNVIVNGGIVHTFVPGVAPFSYVGNLPERFCSNEVKLNGDDADWVVTIAL
tara:strand:+ start:250 stop:633 length:384 start_codon:yes stop_codon:yes gene_type:complete